MIVKRIAGDLRGTGLELKKRQYLPFVITSVCPTCGIEVSQDLTRNYLSYPCQGEVRIVFYHDNADEDDAPYLHHEWGETLVLDIVLTPTGKPPILL